jgi:hypothetical protein
MGSFACGGRTVPRRCAEQAVEDLPRLKAEHLHRVGVLTPGSTVTLQWPALTAVLQTAPGHVRLHLEGRPEVAIALAPVPGPNGGEVPNFACPSCRKRVRHLFLKGLEVGCRSCFRLDYRARHSWTAPEMRLVVQVRRQLGAELALMAPLPERPADPKAARVYDQLAAELQVHETRALARLHGLVRRLERYEQRRRPRYGRSSDRG